MRVRHCRKISNWSVLMRVLLLVALAISAYMGDNKKTKQEPVMTAAIIAEH